MPLHVLKDIHLEIEGKELFSLDKLTIEEGDVIGLIGKNGAGKTCLLRILSGELTDFSGSVSGKASTCFGELRLTEDDLKSGGELAIANFLALLRLPTDLFLLDEPTTYLDNRNFKKVVAMIKRSPSSFCIASHDRALLEEVATKIWVIEQGKVKQYDCSYEDYLTERAYEISHYQSELKNYEREKRKIRKTLQQMKEKKDKKKGKPRKMSASEYRIVGVKTSINVKQKKLQKGITQQEDKLNQLKQPKQVTEDYDISFLSQANLRPKRQLVIPAYSAFIGEKCLWQSQDLTLKSGDRLAIKGANGSGKTTFLNYLYTSLPTAYKVGYFRQSHLDFLDSNDTVLAAVSEKADRRLEESQLRTLLALLDFKREKVFRKIKDLSRGERVKISFLALLVSDLDVLLLDEITNFLDMKTIEACENVLNTFPGILVFVSHDYYFIEHVANRVLDIKTWQQENDT